MRAGMGERWKRRCVRAGVGERCVVCGRGGVCELAWGGSMRCVSREVTI